MAGRAFDLFPRKFFVALNVLIAMRTGEFEFAHRCKGVGESQIFFRVRLKGGFKQLFRNQPSPKDTILESTLRRPISPDPPGETEREQQ